MNERYDTDLRFALNTLDDHRCLISAARNQRGEVVKWAFALNVGISAASVALTSPGAAMWFFLLSVALAAIAAMLLAYYHDRLTKVRQDAFTTENDLAHRKIDFRKITGKAPTRPSKYYDWDELLVLSMVLILSVFPTGLVWAIVAWKL